MLDKPKIGFIRINMFLTQKMWVLHQTNIYFTFNITYHLEILYSTKYFLDLNKDIFELNWRYL